MVNDDVVDVLVAQQRQSAREQARSWAVIDEVLHRRRFTGPEVIDRRPAATITD